MLVSSLCTTSPCAACRISSAQDGPDPRRQVVHDLPLRRGRQRNLQIACSRSSRWNGIPLPYFKSAIIAPVVGVVLLRADARGRIGREELAAQIAAQFFELVDRRR